MDDKATIDVDHALHVVAGRLGRVAVAHRPGVGLSEDQDRLVAILQDLLPAHEPILAATEGLDRGGERLPMPRLVVETLGHRLIHDVEPVEVVSDLLFGMRDITGETISAGDVFWARYRAHLGSVQRDQPTTDQAGLAAELDEGGAGADDGFRVVMTEGGDGAVIRCKLAQQPERFEVANTGAFQMARGPDLVEITPDVEPQHIARMVSGTPGCRRNGAAEAKLSQV